MKQADFYCHPNSFADLLTMMNLNLDNCSGIIDKTDPQLCIHCNMHSLIEIFSKPKYLSHKIDKRIKISLRGKSMPKKKATACRSEAAILTTEILYLCQGLYLCQIQCTISLLNQICTCLSYVQKLLNDNRHTKFIFIFQI